METVKEKPETKTAPTKTAVEPDFILRVRKDRKTNDMLECGLRDLDEATFLAANAYITKSKEMDAVKFLIKELRVSGCEASEITGNFIACRAAVKPLLELISPLEGELKKN